MLPFLLNPYLKKVLWGGSAISDFKGMNTPLDHVGESWEVSAMPGCESVVDGGPFDGVDFAALCREKGQELLGKRIYEEFGGDFPLLIKYIDAVGDLSVQVHPGDEIAYSRHGCRGKSEMWYIVKTEPGAKLVPGLSAKVDSAEFERRVADGTFGDVLASCPTRPGDVFYIPAGRVHAIGAGNFIVEVQAASDITYRIHDYNRRDKDGNLRELHVNEAREVIDFTVCDDYRIYPSGECLLTTPGFSVYKMELDDEKSRIINGVDFSVIMCIDGKTIAESDGHEIVVDRGHTLFVPANTPVRLSGKSTLLHVVP